MLPQPVPPGSGARSLFILSLPRSLSSIVHKACCAALGLQSPIWTSAGEIMNGDRVVLQAGRGLTSLKYTLPQHAQVYGQTKAYLDHVFRPTGFCYKDVVQPFVVADWLRESPAVPVIKIVPNVAHAALSMLSRNWLYPTLGATHGPGTPAMMVSGLLQAERAIGSVPGESVAYDDLIFSLEPLWRALSRLYPGRALGPVAPEPKFEDYRTEVLRRRTLEPYLALHEMEREMRATGVPARAS